MKEADRKKAVLITEKDTKISELKKAGKKSEDAFKKLTIEKNNQEESLKSEVLPVVYLWCSHCFLFTYIHSFYSSFITKFIYFQISVIDKETRKDGAAAGREAEGDIWGSEEMRDCLYI